MIGKVLGHYRIDRLLGKGGMGEVYVAHDTKLRRDVALKILPPTVAQSAERRQRFEREALAVAALNHPNIVTIYSVDEADGVPFLTMELVDGQLLSEICPADGFSVERFLPLAVALADAVAAAHDKGITHRDLKPANVMLDAAGRVKVLDFGLAKLMEPETSDAAATMAMAPTHETAQGSVLGTAFYMSPEQAEGRPVDARSDVFSLGIVFYEMLTGRRPFDGATNVSVISSILKDEPPPVHEVKSILPRHLGRIIGRCLAKDPEKRYQSAKELRNELETFQTEFASGEHGQRPAGPPRGQSRIPWIAAAMVTLVVAALGFLWLRGGGPGDVADAPEAGAVGVIGFENLSDPADAEQLGRMLTGLVTTYLVESGGLDVVSMPQVLSSLREVSGEGDRAFDPSLAPAAATKAGADRMVVGQIGRADDRIILTAELVDVASGKTLGSQHREASSSKELFDLARDIAEDVRAQLGATQGPAAGLDLQHALTQSPAAYRQFVAGEVALNQTRWRDAVQHLVQAIREDPTFALAYYRKAIAEWWEGSLASASATLAQGMPHLDRLPERWQAMYRALDAYTNHDFDQAFRIVDGQVRSSPDLADAWYLLGEIHVHQAKYYDPVRALECFRKTLALEPSFTVSLYHLTDLLLDGEQFDEAHAILERLRAAAPDDPAVVESRIALLAARGEPEKAIQLGEASLGEGNMDIVRRLVYATVMAGNWDRAIALSEEYERRSVERTLGEALSMRGELSACSGRFREARKLHEEGIQLLLEHGGYEMFSELRTLQLIWVLRMMGENEAAIAAARRSVENLPAFFQMSTRLVDLLAEAGRTDEAQRALNDLESRVSGAGSSWGRYCLELARAYLSFHQGAYDDALDRIQSARRHPRIERSAGNEYALEGAIQRARGDAAAAVTAYRRALDPRSLGAVFSCSDLVEPLYGLGVAEQEAGDYAAAREHLTQYLDRLGNADVPIASVADARRRLEALAREN